MAGYTQIRVGYSKQYMTKKYPDLKMVDHPQYPYLIRNTPDGLFTYFLDESDICYQCSFTPNRDTTLTSFIDFYNTNYMKRTETIWITDENPVVLIELHYHQKTDLYFFTYKIETNE
jgi:hypothetical protein